MFVYKYYAVDVRPLGSFDHHIKIRLSGPDSWSLPRLPHLRSGSRLPLPYCLESSSSVCPSFSHLRRKEVQNETSPGVT